MVYPSSGTGAWEAALVNTLSPGDRVLMFETGHFATLWRQMATRLGLDIEFVPGDWRHGVDPAQVAEKLAADREHRIKAVCVVHNETSTGVTSRIAEIRAAIDRARHPALFMVDTISSLASIDYRHDEWRVDVTVGRLAEGADAAARARLQRGLRTRRWPPRKTARLTRSYWDWEAMLETGRTGFFPYTPATNLLFGLREALTMLLDEEGLAGGVPPPCAPRRGDPARRRRLGARGAVRRSARVFEFADRGRGARRLRRRPGARHHPRRLSTCRSAPGSARCRGKIFRIGHLGHFNDLMLCGTLCGVEMGLHRAGIPHRAGGVAAALEYLGSRAVRPRRRRRSMAQR